MRLLFVVQRYGREVPGGAEQLSRELATRLAGRGHDLEVLTSRALSYVDWADAYPAGTEELDGVTVHRLSVEAPRHDGRFNLLNSRAVWGYRPVPLHLQEHWIRSSGPLLPVLPWLGEHAGGFDVVAFFSYLYYPTWAGLPVASSLTATVLHPTAHDEPSLYLPLFRTTFRHPAAFAFSTEEERALVGRLFGSAGRSAVIGIGVDLDAGPGAGETAFREAYNIDRPYLLFLGRVDASKGAEELFDFFLAYKKRNPGSLTLVLVGDPARPLPHHPDVIVTGVVGEDMKRAALDGALALVQPSYWESFSMVLTEAWAARKAALVQGHCAVLDGQVRRSGGGIPYRGFAEFEMAVRRITEEPDLARRLGVAGRRYAEAHYGWDTVLDRYEMLLSRATRSSPADTAPR